MLRFDCVLATLFPPQSRESGFNHSRVRITDNGEQRSIPVRFQKHLHRLMPSYREKDSADPQFPVRPRGS